jgi:GTP-dependent dephospho-CoA kinase
MGSGEGEHNTAVLLSLPEALRDEFKDPFGPIFTDPEALLADVEGPLVAIGDVVTYHLLGADRIPELTMVDGYTERSPVDEAIREGIEAGTYDRMVTVSNPAAALSAPLVEALAEVLSALGTAGSGFRNETNTTERTMIEVDGEEDLAALPAILGAPAGTTVVYGQPGEGMVRVTVAERTRERARALLAGMDGDHEAVWERLGVASE